ENIIRKNFGKKAKVLQGLENYEELMDKPGLNEIAKIKIKIDGDIYVVDITLDITYSPRAGKLGSEYFEGILQLRNARQEVKDYVKSFLDKNFSKGIYVNKVVDKDDSVDYFFVNKKHINLLAQ